MAIKSRSKCWVLHTVNHKPQITITMCRTHQYNKEHADISSCHNCHLSHVKYFPTDFFALFIFAAPSYCSTFNPWKHPSAHSTIKKQKRSIAIQQLPITHSTNNLPSQWHTWLISSSWNQNHGMLMDRMTAVPLSRQGELHSNPDLLDVKNIKNIKQKNPRQPWHSTTSPKGSQHSLKTSTSRQWTAPTSSSMSRSTTSTGSQHGADSQCTRTNAHSTSDLRVQRTSIWRWGVPKILLWIHGLRLQQHEELLHMVEKNIRTSAHGTPTSRPAKTKSCGSSTTFGGKPSISSKTSTKP